MLIDTHCHLDFPAYKEGDSPDSKIPLPEVLATMRKHGVSTAICIGVNMEDWEGVYQLATKHPNLYCTVGVHPDYELAREPSTEELIEWGGRAKVVAIGECGLDFHHRPERPLWQEKRFIRHIEASRSIAKPLVIHSRDSGQRMLEMLKDYQAGVADGGAGGVLHCFTDTWEIAKGALDMGFYISFSGIVSFKSATQLQDVAKKVPADRFVIETDSPYLAPIPHRGKTNQPAFVSFVAECLATLRHESFATIAKQSTKNAERLFNITVPVIG